MAIRLADVYTDVDAADADYPGGAFKNSSGPSTTDGTPLEQQWTRDMWGFLDAILAAAGTAYSGSPDTATASQRLDALRLLFFSTGDMKPTIKTVADPGWVMANDGTIGSATSGATTRANADCAALYALLWNNVSNTYAPVTSGRGASAAADFAANKPIKLGSILGRVLGASGTGSGLTARTLGQTVGEENHLLTTGEIPSHAHGINSPYSTGNESEVPSILAIGQSVQGTLNLTTGTAGSGGTHNNIQPTAFVNWMFKL